MIWSGLNTLRPNFLVRRSRDALKHSKPSGRGGAHSAEHGPQGIMHLRRQSFPHQCGLKVRLGKNSGGGESLGARTSTKSLVGPACRRDGIATSCREVFEDVERVDGTALDVRLRSRTRRHGHVGGGLDESAQHASRAVRRLFGEHRGVHRGTFRDHPAADASPHTQPFCSARGLSVSHAESSVTPHWLVPRRVAECAERETYRGPRTSWTAIFGRAAEAPSMSITSCVSIRPRRSLGSTAEGRPLRGWDSAGAHRDSALDQHVWLQQVEECLAVLHELQ